MTTKTEPRKRSPRKAKAAVITAAMGAASELEPTHATEWIELFPHGISVNTTLGRPVMILKDKHGVEVLPVWMAPLDAGVALAELSHAVGATPHSVTRRLLEMMNLRLETCSFIEIVGHHQFVDLVFKSEKETKTMRVRADEAMSFCLQGRARFYSTRSFMARCRSLDIDLAKFEQNILEGAVPGLQAEMENSSKKHPYVM